MHSVYLLKSLSSPEHRYIGCTADLKKRLHEHNTGQSTHTSKYAPWSLISYIAFETKEKAETFERYLKHGSGHAFANRHFW